MLNHNQENLFMLIWLKVGRFNKEVFLVLWKVLKLQLIFTVQLLPKFTESIKRYFYKITHFQIIDDPKLINANAEETWIVEMKSSEKLDYS